MKKSMSWIDIRVWIEEQRRFLEGSYVDNLYLVGNTIVLRLRCIDGEYRELVAEPGRRICFTKRRVRGESMDPRQQQWRSLVRSCRVVGVEQLGEERVVFLKLRCGEALRKLVIELLPRGVACVVREEDGRILLTTESRAMRDRVVRPGATYVPPPSRRPLREMSVEDLAKALESGKDLIRGLIRGWGLPPEVAETVVHDLRLDPSAKSVDLATVEKLRSYVLELIDRIVRGPQPCIVIRGGELEGFYPFKPPTRVAGAEVREFPTFNEAVDEYFALLESAERRVPEEVRREIEKLERAIERIGESIEARKRELEELRRVLRVFEESYSLVERIHELAREVVRSRGWDELGRALASLGVRLRSCDPSRGVYRIDLGGVEIELDVRRSVIEIYSGLRKRVSELEKDIERSAEERERLSKQLEELRRRAAERIEAERMRLARKVEWFERFHWTITSNGFLVLGGRDASQNISLLRRYLEPRDVVMHADVHGASAIVLKSGGKEIPEQDLLEAATLAACYSKAWKAGRRCVDVFWVRGDQISLSAPPGEYLPRGSFMVYGRKNFVRCVELKLALGIEIVENRFCRIFVGPEHLVAKRCVAYMVIEPGDEDPSRVAKRFLEELRRRGLGVVAECVDVSEVALRVPGRAKIIKFVIRGEGAGVGDAQSPRRDGSQPRDDKARRDGDGGRQADEGAEHSFADSRGRRG